MHCDAAVSPLVPQALDWILERVPEIRTASPIVGREGNEAGGMCDVRACLARRRNSDAADADVTPLQAAYLGYSLKILQTVSEATTTIMSDW